MNINEREAAFVALMPQVAAAMPGEWTITRSSDWYAIMQRQSDGLEIGGTFSAYKASGKVEFRPSVPLDETGGGMSLKTWGVIPYDAKPPSRSVSLERTPDAIAKDVTKHVLTPYEPLYAEIVKRKAERTDSRAQWLADAKRIAAHIGDRMPAPHNIGSDRINLGSRYGGNGSLPLWLTVNIGGRHTAEIRNLSAEDAIALADWLKSRNT